MVFTNLVIEFVYNLPALKVVRCGSCSVLSHLRLFLLLFPRS